MMGFLKRTFYCSLLMMGGAVACIHSNHAYDEDEYVDSADASLELFSSYEEALDMYERIDL